MYDTLTAGGALKGQLRGAISSLALTSADDLLAIGTYSHDIGLLDQRAPQLAAVLAGHSGGITHMKFSRCVRVEQIAAARSMRLSRA